MSCERNSRSHSHILGYLDGSNAGDVIYRDGMRFGEMRDDDQDQIIKSHIEGSVVQLSILILQAGKVSILKHK